MTSPNDPRLPQLGTVLDERAMAARLESACLDSGSAWRIRRCEVGHVRYKPGKNCLIRYDAALTGAADRGQIWYGLAYEPGTSGSRWEKARQPAADVEAGPGVAHLEDLGMVLWAFPNDRKLRGLDVLTDRRRLAEEVFGSSNTDCSIELVRYVPEHACTVKLTSAEGVYFAKVHGAGDADAICANARALGREAWSTPRHRIGVQREIAGVAANGVTDLAECAKALARLHVSRVDGLPESAEIGSRMERARLLLGGRPWAERLIAEAERRCAGSDRVATLHGDLHIKNFLVHGSGAELIDLDTLCKGDPIEDVASFVASLYHRALLAGGEADSAASEFVSAYRAAAPWAIRDDEIAAHAAKALIVERACRSITRCKGDVVDPLLAIARRLLHTGCLGYRKPETARDWMEHFMAQARSRAGEVLDVHYKTYRKAKSWSKSNVTVTWRDGSGIQTAHLGPEPRGWRFPGDPSVPWMAIAADPGAVLEHLPVRGAKQVTIEVLNYRPGNRLTARYTVDGVTIYGKTYSDERGVAVHERFVKLSGIGYPIPRALGYSAAIKTVWQESFGGAPLAGVLGQADESRLMRGAAARLRLLHESGLECPPRLTLAEQHADLAKKMAKLATVVPEQETRLMHVVETLGARMSRLAPIARHVVHGDFHLRQLMVRDGEVALFDFDELGAGDPVEDFGHFIADLHGYGWSAGRVAQLSGSLMERYVELSGELVPGDRLRWHTAAQLLTRAYRALLQLRPDFDERVSHHLSLAESLA